MRSVKPDIRSIEFRDMGSSLRHLKMVDECAKASAAGVGSPRRGIDTQGLLIPPPMHYPRGTHCSLLSGSLLPASKQLWSVPLISAADRHCDCDIEGSIDDIGVILRWGASRSTMHF
jgi:hypothetical protein